MGPSFRQTIPSHNRWTRQDADEEVASIIPTSDHMSLVHGGLRAEMVDPAIDPRWDALVHKHPFGWVTHHSVWKQVLERTFPHMKGYYLALSDSHGILQAGMPLFEVDSWLTGKRLVSVPFGTLCDPLIESEHQFRLLASSAMELSASLHCKYVQLRTLHSSSMIPKPFTKSRLNYKYHFLRLDKKPDQLIHSFHRTCVRQRIMRCQNSNFTLRIGRTERDLQEVFHLYLRTRKRRGLPPQPYHFLRNTWAALYPAGMVSVLIAEHGGKAVAGLILFKFGEKVSAEIAVMDEKYKRMSPNHFLFWEGIKLAIGEGYKTFDFGRTASVDETLMTFKERWGTEVQDLPIFYDSLGTCEPPARNLPGAQVLKNICAHLPDLALLKIGSLLYQHRD